MEKATVVHTSRTDKESVEFKWNFPEEPEKGKKIKFVYTVLQSFDQFWAMQESKEIKLISGKKFC